MKEQLAALIDNYSVMAVTPNGDAWLSASQRKLIVAALLAYKQPQEDVSDATWWRWLWKLTGGRPMVREGCAFIDCVTHKEVFYWRDRLGNRWMAFGAWDLFRVERKL